MSNSKEATACKQVLEYLVGQNRPYSAIDIFNNLHKEHGKTAITRALDQLVSEQKLKEKTYGKQKIYYPVQTLYPDPKDMDIKSMDVAINDLQHKITDINQQIKNNESTLLNLNKFLTTERAEIEVKRLKTEIPQLQEKLCALESNNMCISSEEKEAIISAKVKIYKEWQRRKRMANEILDAILESYPHGKEKLYDEIGVENDNLNSNKRQKK